MTVDESGSGSGKAAQFNTKIHSISMDVKDSNLYLSSSVKGLAFSKFYVVFKFVKTFSAGVEKFRSIKKPSFHFSCEY